MLVSVKSVRSCMTVPVSSCRMAAGRKVLHDGTC